MTLYQKFKRLKIDFSAIALEQSDTKVTYFCTPKGAKIIGWTGVDGIHYCFVRGQEEMVFAVNPSNLPGDHVHPIARSFEDMLRLLLACGSMDAIEQAHHWDEEQFDEYVAENQPTFTEEQREQVQDEHPLNMRFRAVAELNGKPLREERGTCMTWIPESCLEDGVQTRQESKWFLAHYGLDLSRAWAIHRLSFRWVTKRPPVIKTLCLHLEREPISVPGVRFKNPKAGDGIPFTHPVTGEAHTLTVREYQAHEMDAKHFRDESMEYPTHSIAMAYTIWPEIPDGFSIRDCGEGDHPRRKHTAPGSPVATASVGIIGLYRREEGDPVYYHPDGTEARPRAMFSNLHFAPVEDVEWRFVFQKKLMEDIAVELI